jgi:hypothetical protein
MHTLYILVRYRSDFVGFFQNYPHPFWGGKYVSFFEDWEILNNELNVLKLEFIVNSWLLNWLLTFKTGT